MNLRKWINNVFAIESLARLFLPCGHPRSRETFFGQNAPMRLDFCKSFMPSLFRARLAFVVSNTTPGTVSQLTDRSPKVGAESWFMSRAIRSALVGGVAALSLLAVLASV